MTEHNAPVMTVSKKKVGLHQQRIAATQQLGVLITIISKTISVISLVKVYGYQSKLFVLKFNETSSF